MVEEGLYCWGEGVPHVDTVEAWIAVFEREGYRVCRSSEPEAGYEKVALFATEEDAPTHVARQLPSGRWTSKLGKLEDIEHDLGDLAESSYGQVVQSMKRPTG